MKTKESDAKQLHIKIHINTQSEYIVFTIYGMTELFNYDMLLQNI